MRDRYSPLQKDENSSDDSLKSASSEQFRPGQRPVLGTIAGFVSLSVCRANFLLSIVNDVLQLVPIGMGVCSDLVSLQESRLKTLGTQPRSDPASTGTDAIATLMLAFLVLSETG